MQNELVITDAEKQTALRKISADLAEFYRRYPEEDPRSSGAPAQVNAYAMVRAVADEAGESYHDVISSSRVRRLVSIRQTAARRLRDAGLSYPEIGRQLGNRDHSTIIHLLRRVRSEGEAREASVAGQGPTLQDSQSVPVVGGKL